jgi:hypothetical protein
LLSAEWRAHRTVRRGRAIKVATITRQDGTVVVKGTAIVWAEPLEAPTP